MTEMAFEEALRSGANPVQLRELAKKSNRTFVRSLGQIAEDTSGAKGRRLTAFEALASYGSDVVLNTILEGSTLLCDSIAAAGKDR